MDERTDPDLMGGELETLGQFLDYHRATLRIKCSDLTEDQLTRRAVPPSTMSLLGLVRHLTEVEQNWFGLWLDGQQVTQPYSSPRSRDGDFDDLGSHPVPEVWATYDAAVTESRRVLATYADGGDLSRGGPGRPRHMRWIVAHMLEEYARHNGHADLLREAVDGVRGE